jgi:hypothetical protein
MKILNAVMIVSLFQLHVCYAAQQQVIVSSESEDVEQLRSEYAQLDHATYMESYRQHHKECQELIASSKAFLMDRQRQMIDERDEIIQILQLEGLQKTQTSTESLLPIMKSEALIASSTALLIHRQRQMIDERDEIIESLQLEGLQKTQTSIESLLPIMKEVQMAGKQHYVYNKAFEKTDLESIKSPTDQRELLKKMQECQSEVRSILFPKQKNSERDQLKKELEQINEL